MASEAAVRVFYVQAYTYAGCIGSHGHWYGRLTSRDEMESVSLERTLTAAAALRMNKQDRPPRGALYRPGDTSSRFDSREELNLAAVDKARALTGGDSFVVLDGHAAYCDPLPVIAAPAWVKERADRLMSLWEECGGWEGTSRQVKKAKTYAAEWDALIAEVEAA